MDKIDEVIKLAEKEFKIYEEEYPVIIYNIKFKVLKKEIIGLIKTLREDGDERSKS